jgi:hypothetical protein
MRRRRVLRSLSVAAVAAVAGCTSGPNKSGPKWGPPETEPDVPSQDHSTLTPESTPIPTTRPGFGLQTSFTYQTSADGAFLVTVTVENTADVSRTAVLVVTWTSGDQSRVQARQLSLDSGASTGFEFEFPSFGNLEFDFTAP